MTTLQLSPRDRRTLVVGGTLVASIIGFGKGVPALRRWEADRVEAAATVRRHLAMADQTARSASWVRDSATTRARALERERARMIRSTTPEAAAAMLATIVEKMARDQVVDITAMTLRPDSTRRLGFTRVAVRFSAECDVEGLVNLLTLVEMHGSRLAVRELSIVQAEPAAPAARMEALRFEATVETIAHLDAAPPSMARRTNGS